MTDPQKEFKKRLKALMNRPENQVCTDCTERSPRWASLIVLPPDIQQQQQGGLKKIGSFCCLECSGSHRRLGVHITFVRSVNLDSWKEEEVLMMEHGGNAKVNAIFEARLAPSGVQKPTNHADLQTRERFIRDKYERRKYYDASAFGTFRQAAAAEAAPAAPSAASHHFEADFGNALFSPVAPAPATSIGPPSDAARRRLEARGRGGGGGMTPEPPSSQQDRDNSNYHKSPKRETTVRRTKSSDKMLRPVAAAPISAPLTMDLLDFQSDNAFTHDAFAAAPAPAAAAPIDLFDFAAPEPTLEPGRSRSPVPPSGSTSGRRRGDGTRTKSSERKPESGSRPMRRSTSSEKLPIREPPRRTRSSEKLESPRRSKSSEKLMPQPPPSSAAADILALYSSPVPARQSFAPGGGGSASMNGGMQGNMHSMQNMNQMQALMQQMNMGSGNNSSMNGGGNGLMSGISSMSMQQQQNPQAAAMMQQQYQQQQQMRMYQQQQMMMQQQQQQGMPNIYAQQNARMAAPGHQQMKQKKAVDPNDPFADCSGDFSTDFKVNQFR